MKAARSLLPFLFLLVTGSSYASGPDSLGISFSQELDTRIWHLQAGRRVENALWNVQSRGYSEWTQRALTGFESQWKQELGFTLQAERAVEDHLALLLEANGQDYLDREAVQRIDLGAAPPLPQTPSTGIRTSRLTTGLDNHIGRASLRGGVRWRVAGGLETRLLAGAAMDRQVQGSGEGPS
ncbi:MAG TPA: hypothetical protein ENI92_02535, partial [Bacteroidetes bacterium]|nr:hypothetical protein [Bacteroidota bacterium]